MEVPYRSLLATLFAVLSAALINIHYHEYTYQRLIKA